jgi:hypothetical protein
MARTRLDEVYAVGHRACLDDNLRARKHAELWSRRTSWRADKTVLGGTETGLQRLTTRSGTTGSKSESSAMLRISSR